MRVEDKSEKKNMKCYTTNFRHTGRKRCKGRKNPKGTQIMGKSGATKGLKRRELMDLLQKRRTEVPTSGRTGELV